MYYITLSRDFSYIDYLYRGSIGSSALSRSIWIKEESLPLLPPQVRDLIASAQRSYQTATTWSWYPRSSVGVTLAELAPHIPDNTWFISTDAHYWVRNTLTQDIATLDIQRYSFYSVFATTQAEAMRVFNYNLDPPLEFPVEAEGMSGVIHDGVSTFKLTDSEFAALTGSLIPPQVPGNGGTRRCGACGETGHNRRTCTGSRVPWLKIGVEIEGCWVDADAMRAKARALGCSVVSDGSVSTYAHNTPQEIRSVPESSFLAVASQVHALYPDEANRSCGMHVHVSFNPTDVAFIANGQFFQFFRDRWKSWGERMGIPPESEFWQRLAGDNNYCRLNTREFTTQESLTNGDRYMQLNFCSLTRHRTVECRLLPMFRTEKLALLAIWELLDIYKTWFATMADSVMTETEVTSENRILVPEAISEEFDLTRVLLLGMEEWTDIPIRTFPESPPGLVRMPRANIIPFIRNYLEVA